MLRDTILKNDEIFVIFVAIIRSDSGPWLRGVFDELFVVFAYVLKVLVSPEQENTAQNLTFMIEIYFQRNFVFFGFIMHKLQSFLVSPNRTFMSRNTCLFDDKSIFMKFFEYISNCCSRYSRQPSNPSRSFTEPLSKKYT